MDKDPGLCCSLELKAVASGFRVKPRNSEEIDHSIAGFFGKVFTGKLDNRAEAGFAE